LERNILSGLNGATEDDSVSETSAPSSVNKHILGESSFINHDRPSIGFRNSVDCLTNMHYKCQSAHVASRDTIQLIKASCMFVAPRSEPLAIQITSKG